MDAPRKAIQKEFRHFLTSFVDDKGQSVYGNRIRQMCTANDESLNVSFLHLQQFKAILAYYVSNSPAQVLKIFDVVAMSVVADIFEAYAQIKSEIHVRVTDLPSADSLRDLRQTHLNTLVRVSGVVTRRTAVFPQLTYVKFDCQKCGHKIGPIPQDATQETRINYCPSCESRGPFAVDSENTVYRNYQRITLQEEPGSVPAGRLPRHREVVLLWDLIDSARPGESIVCF
jgi:DNA replication licensing factor MCM2